MIIDFCKKLPQNSIIKPIINQLMRSGTSIGANYSEADEASSKKDFINKICIAKKETKETKYWLRMSTHAIIECKEEAAILWKEAQELNLIFGTIGYLFERIKEVNKMKFTKYEIARIIGARALQLAMGAPMLLNLDDKELEEINFSTIDIAKKEFEQGVLPITIRRPMPEKSEK